MCGWHLPLLRRHALANTLCRRCNLAKGARI
jgi:hypothetical protein